MRLAPTLAVALLATVFALPAHAVKLIFFTTMSGVCSMYSYVV